jgi:hypothetical protein
MISIEGLLEDEQGLSMGEMLTAKFRNLAMSLPAVLACVLYLIHWY